MQKFKRVLLTGASKGLGQEIAKALVNRTENFVLVARNKDALESFKQSLIKEYQFKGEIDVLSIDLSKPEAIEKIKAYPASVDLVINNAGVGFMNKFELNTEAEIAQMVMVNNYNLSLITHHFAKLMLKDGKGQIINIGSLAGLISTPLFGVYGATKAFVISLSKSLDAEYRERGVRVKVICPGGITTNFHQTAGMTDKILEVNKKLMETPSKTAQDVLNLIDGNDTILIPRFYNKAIKFFSHVLPTRMMANETKKMYTQFLKD